MNLHVEQISQTSKEHGQLWGELRETVGTSLIIGTSLSKILMENREFSQYLRVRVALQQERIYSMAREREDKAGEGIAHGKSKE